MNVLGQYDHKTGAEKKWWCGPVSSLQEPCFIPRSADAPEGDGYIVMVQNLLAENLSNLLLFEATDIEQGPIATIKLPVRLRFGLHGNWTPGEQLKPLA
jgi:carotenoid cleavage dioxygenase